MGPVMIGPSSSHTAGAVRIGLVARELFEREPAWIDAYLYGSFAKTYRGHGTDKALVGGLLNFDTADERIQSSIDMAVEKGIRISFHEESAILSHPNTVKLVIGNDKNSLELTAISIGGGKVEIMELNGFELNLSGNHSAVLVFHQDQHGIRASVANILTNQRIKTRYMNVARKENGETALMVIEVAQSVPPAVISAFKKIPSVLQVATISE